MRANLKTQYEYRGYFIDKFSELEQAMDKFLADYFVPYDESFANELTEILIDRINFEGKRTAIRFIFERLEVTNKIRGIDATPKSVKKNILEDIRRLSLVRNYFAHYQSLDISSLSYLDLTKDIKGIVIILMQQRDETSYITYTEEDYYKEIDKIEQSKTALLKMING